MAEIASCKVCSACKVEKPLSDYGKQPRYRDGYRNQCNRCRSLATAAYFKTPAGKESIKRTRACPQWREKAAWKKREEKHGISRYEYDAMLASQGGCCAICRRDNPGTSKGLDTFHIDHCHVTGRIRGLLCQGCNTSLGKLGDTPEALLRAYQYVSANL